METGTDNKNERAALRRAVLAARDRLSGGDIRQKSAAIRRKLLSLDTVREAGTIFVYVNFRSEVETLGFIGECLERDIQVCVPLTVARTRELAVFGLTAPERQLRPGYCGIPEPDPERCRPVDPAAIDTVILPGSVFDEWGGRLGYGGGYYDRFLAGKAPAATRVGIAFDLQTRARPLPLEPHDQRLHQLITESRVLTFEKERRP